MFRRPSYVLSHPFQSLSFTPIRLFCAVDTDFCVPTESPLNPLNPHDALKHHFKSVKTDLILLKLEVLERKFPWNWFTNTW